MPQKSARSLFEIADGDAIFTQRPLLEAIQEYERDYLFQVKENQPKVWAKLRETFKDAVPQQTNVKMYNEHLSKKRGCRDSPSVGEAWTLLTSIAVSLGRLLWEGEPTLKEVGECCSIDPIPTAKKLGWIP